MATTNKKVIGLPRLTYKQLQIRILEKHLTQTWLANLRNSHLKDSETRTMSPQPTTSLRDQFQVITMLEEVQQLVKEWEVIEELLHRERKLLEIMICLLLIKDLAKEITEHSKELNK